MSTGALIGGAIFFGLVTVWAMYTLDKRDVISGVILLALVGLLAWWSNQPQAVG